ncbi:uncharacterized protein LOC108703822 [Xenopus laevis]|uniref:Uncharacterized protein LOC108703822 n=1 Tax=Xenopus laevis TaxID=8355 RepID=A0A8J1LRV0_XENLA|nr:uncharacterized protein LOC108703822 [Xenopus laevis]
MALDKIFLLCWICCSSVWILPTEAMLKIKDEAPPIATLGSDVTLPCTFSVAQPVNLQYLAIIWIFQKQELVRLDNKGMKPNPRVTFINADAKKGIASVQLHNVTVTDAGVYTCSVIYSPNIRSKDITLKVQSLPTVEVLEEITEEQSMIVCSVSRFYPKDITVTIIQEGKDLTSSVLSNYQHNLDGTFSLNRSLTLEDSVKQRSMSCRVQHESLAEPIEKDLLLLHKVNEESNNAVVFGAVGGCAVLLVLVIIGIVYCKYIRKKGQEMFIMSDIQGPSVWIDGVKLRLYCTTSNCSHDAKVTWIVKAQDGTESEFSEAGTGEAEEEQPLISREYIVSKEKTIKSQKNGLGDYSSTFCFIPSVSRHLGTSVSCKFVCGGKTQEKTFQFKSIQAKPKFIEPISMSLCDSGNVQLLATLERFYPKEGIKVTWRCNKDKSLETNAPIDEFITHPDNTFTVRSKYEIPGDRFKDPDFKVCVLWKHDSMEKAESREVSVKDFPWHPTIDDIPLQSERENNKLRLSCNISNYFPDALTVIWFGKKKGSQELFSVSKSDIYDMQMPQSQRGTNHTYKCQACLVISAPESMEQDMEYICRVEHPSLKEPIQGGTGPINKYDLAEKQSFIVHNIQGPQRWQEGEKVTLYGTALYCKKDVQVTWMVIEMDGTKWEIPDITESGVNDYVACSERSDRSDLGGLMDITTSLSFTPSVSRHRSMSLKCKFVCDGKFSEKLFQYKELYAKPKCLKPIKFSLLENGAVLCSLSLQQFYPKSMKISWGAGVPPSCDKMESDEEVTDSGITYDLLSKCKIPGRLLHDPNFTFKASWKHEFMSDWESTQLSIRDPGFPWKPVVQNIPVPNLFVNNPVTLMCQVSNIFPEYVTVKWFRREKDGEDLFPVPHSEKYKIPEIKLEKQEDKTFQCQARLTFTPTISSEQGAEFICRVEHPSLEKAEERRTGPLQIQEEKTFISEKKKLIVNDIQGPDKWTQGREVTLYAMASYCPKDINVIWIIRERDGKVWEICDTPTERGKKPTAQGLSRYVVTRESTDTSDKEGLLNVSSSMRFIPSVSAHSGVSLMCRFVCDGKSKEREFKPRAIYAKPKLLEPIKPEWCNSEKVKYSLNLEGFYPKDMEITWTSGVGKKKKKKSSDQLQENPNRTFNIQSDCTINQKFFRDPRFKVCVSWKHESMENPQSREFSLQDLGTEAQPVVLPHPETDVKPQPLVLPQPETDRKPQPVVLPQPETNGKPQPVVIPQPETDGKPQPLVLPQPETDGKSPPVVLPQPETDGNPRPVVIPQPETDGKPEPLVLPQPETNGKPQPVVLPQPETDGKSPPVVLPQPETDGKSPPVVLPQPDTDGKPQPVVLPQPETDGKPQPVVLPQPETDGKSPPVVLPQPETDGKSPPVVLPQPDTDGKPQPVVIPQPETDGKKWMKETREKAQPPMPQPVNITLCCDSGEVLFSLKLLSFYPKEIQTEWHLITGPSKNKLSSTPSLTQNSDETWNIESNCKVSGNKLRDPKSRVSVTWKHETMEGPETREISVLDPGFPWAPEIGEIVTPSLVLGEEATFQCKISRCLPAALTVTWWRKEEGDQEGVPVSPGDKYKIPKLTEDYRHFSCTATLSFTPSPLTDNGVEFFCVVEHVQHRIWRGTGPLQVQELWNEACTAELGDTNRGMEVDPEPNDEDEMDTQIAHLRVDLTCLLQSGWGHSSDRRVTTALAEGLLKA